MGNCHPLTYEKVGSELKSATGGVLPNRGKEKNQRKGRNILAYKLLEFQQKKKTKIATMRYIKKGRT